MTVVKYFTKRIFLMVPAILLSSGLFSQSATNRVIAVDVKNVKDKLDRSFNACVGAGRANEGLRADWQRQLRIARAECGFRYIRFHGLLSDDMGVYKEDKNGAPMYNFQYIDELFDFLHSINVKPFVELGFMPNDLASGTQTVFWWKGNVTPPKDYVKWDNLIKQLVQHFTERYGESEVASWYFEVWNEPNLKRWFFSGEQQDYFKLYSETAVTIKSVSPKYRVGGPATAGNAWISDMINFCSTAHTPIDFISTHDYGVKGGFLDVDGSVGTVLNQNGDIVANDMKKTREIIKASALPNLQLHYTEWSASYTSTDPVHDSYEEAAYILNTVRKASRHVNSMSYWTFTDIFEEIGPRMTPFHGGFGLMNYQDIKKPAYYAFSYLNKLGEDELMNSDSSAIVCKDSRNSIQALFWNFTIDHPVDSINNQVFYRRILPAKQAPSVDLSLKNMSPGIYNLKIYKIGYRVNDAYTTYMDMKLPLQLTRAEATKLKTENPGTAITTYQVKINSSGTWHQTIPMRQNDVCLLTFEKRGR